MENAVKNDELIGKADNTRQKGGINKKGGPAR